MSKNININFGSYVTIEQCRHFTKNEHFTHKVIGRLTSNSWVNIPVQCPATEVIHGHSEDVVACICCGVNERQVLNYRLEDVTEYPSEILSVREFERLKILEAEIKHLKDGLKTIVALKDTTQCRDPISELADEPSTPDGWRPIHPKMKLGFNHASQLAQNILQPTT